MMSKSQVQLEIDETKRDLEAFLAARDLIRTRVREAVDDTRPRLLPSVANWSGTDCVLGGLDLTIHALERTLSELMDTLEKAEPDQPRFRIVRDE